MQIKIIVATVEPKDAVRQVHPVIVSADEWDALSDKEKRAFLARSLGVEKRQVVRWSESNKGKPYVFGSRVIITGSPENGNEFVGRWGVIVQEMPMLKGDTEYSYLVAVENNSFGGGLLLCPRKASELALFNGG